MTRKDYTEDLVERAMQYVEAIDDAIDKQFEGEGQRSVPDADFARVVQAKMQEFPPMPIVFPDGSTRVVSPFLAALGECEGGKPVLRRIQRLYGGT